MNCGRREIFTDVKEITYRNVAEVLREAVMIHDMNIADIKKLLEFDLGVQPLMRTKKVRSDIDVQCTDNVANQVTTFHVGFKWGNSISVTQKGNRSKKNEPQSVSLLNECYDLQGIKSKTQELGRYVEVTGIGYDYIDINKDYVDGDSYFTVDVLSPLCAFVVKSSYYIDKRPMMGVSFRTDSKGIRHYTCITKTDTFEINGLDYKITSDEINPFGVINIIEWIRSHDRTGVWEREIPEMNNLNLLVSDFSNDVDQNTQAIWHTNDVDFPEEVIVDENGNEITRVKRPKSNDWFQTFTSPDGRQPFVKPLSIEYDYPGMLNNIIYSRSRILEKCHVPQRNDNSGGSTGTATDMAAGWADAENAASVQQSIMEVCKMNELRVVLAVLRKSPDLPASSPLHELRLSDIQPSIKRRKTSELTTKINFFATAVSHGINGLHALKAIDAFEDVNEVWADSKEMIEMYQNNQFGKEEEGRLSADNSDQINNSPLIDGMRMNKGE